MRNGFRDRRGLKRPGGQENWTNGDVGARTARRIVRHDTGSKKNQRAAAATDIARRAPGHPRTHRSTTAAAMPAPQKTLAPKSSKSAKVVVGRVPINALV